MDDYVSPAKQGIMFDPLLTALKPFQGKPVLLRHLLPVSYTCAVGTFTRSLATLIDRGTSHPDTERCRLLTVLALRLEWYSEPLVSSNIAW